MLEITNDLVRDLEAGRTLVVPSAQRAAAIRLAFAAQQLAHDRRAWRTPDVRSEIEWLERGLLRAADSGARLPRPLRSSEEWCVWREACADSLSDADAQLVDSLADALRGSARLLYDWHVPVAALAGAGSESELLARTLAGVEARTAEMHAAGRHALYRLLSRRDVLEGSQEPGVTFAGFLGHTPARLGLIQAGAGMPIREHVSEASAAAEACRILAPDPEAELELAARWCRDRLARDGRRRFLVVIPDLAQRRELALRTFEHLLAPGSVLAEAPGSAAVALEGGRALSLYPLVHQALRTLDLLCGRLDFAAFSAWLRSPFCAEPATAERARLDVWLREHLELQVEPQALLAVLPGAPTLLRAAADALSRQLAAAMRALGPLHKAVSLSVWLRRFEAALGAAGWPGARLFSSEEEQTRARFQEVMEDGATLAARLGALTAPRALAMLRALSARAAFAPATGDAAVTLSSALVDPIVRYDGIWVAGLHADAWPQPPRLDPFIPALAQRRANIPAASAHLRLGEARRLLEVWRRSARQLVLSAPRHIEDRAQLVSPLLLALPEAAGISDSTRDPLVQRVRAARRMERYVDRAGAAWSSHVLPAGARVIEQQSRCAFRAYAELRLGSSSLEMPHPDIDPRTRGHLIHRTLELLWEGLGGTEGLRQAAHAGNLERLIAAVAHRAIEERRAAGRLKAGQPALEREHRRTMRLVQRLCELELTRPPFRVHALEARRTLTLAGAELSVRIDRIDELGDGTYAVFDYKSGRPGRLGWFDERMAQPQLPVYLLASTLNVSAVAAVHVTSQQAGFRGLADRAGRLPRVQALDAVPEASAAANLFETAWEVQVRSWRAQIEQLARDFSAGHAAVEPLAQACQTCHLHAFCRIADQGQGALAAPDAVDPADE